MNNHYRQVHNESHRFDYHLGYSKHDELDELVMSLNKIEALIFYYHHDPWIFYMWIRDMDQFLDWHNLSNNRRVRFSKIISSGETQFY
jgi:hypothetical protein